MRLAPTSPARLLLPVAAPVIWALHFTATYVLAAVLCGVDRPEAASLAGVQRAAVMLSLVALAGIAVAGLVGLRWHRHGTATLPHDFDTIEDRHRFLGFATVLLAGLSAFGTILVGGSVFFFGSCR